MSYEELCHRDDEICNESRDKFDDYLEKIFPQDRPLHHPSDSIYYQLDAIRLIIAARKVNELYK